MALLENFIERYGVHLFSNRADFSGINAIELEQWAKELHEAREDDEPMPELKAELPAISQRQYQESRELATLAWLWAAAANSVRIGDSKKVHKFLGAAADEFLFEPDFYEKGDLLEHMHSTAELFELMVGEGQKQKRNEVYELMQQHSKLPKPDPVAGNGVVYTPETQTVILRQGLKIIKNPKYLEGFPVPIGENEQRILDEKSKAEGEARQSEAKVERAWVRTRRATQAHTTKTLTASRWQKALNEYDPVDDANVSTSRDGRVSCTYGGMLVDVFDLLGIGNRMIYEVLVRQATQKGEKFTHGKLDLAIPAKTPMHVKRENAIFGTCPVAFDSDRNAWGFEAPYTPQLGVYRRNAIGWIVTK